MDEEPDALHGPRIVPGTYQAKLTVDGKELTRPLIVTMDPRSVATSAELQQQYELGRRMFAEAIRSRRALAQLHSLQEKLAALADQLSAQPTELKTSLSQAQDSIRKTLTGSGARSGNAMGLELAHCEWSRAVIEPCPRKLWPYSKNRMAQQNCSSASGIK